MKINLAYHDRQCDSPRPSMRPPTTDNVTHHDRKCNSPRPSLRLHTTVNVTHNDRKCDSLPPSLRLHTTDNVTHHDRQCDGRRSGDRKASTASGILYQQAVSVSGQAISDPNGHFRSQYGQLPVTDPTSALQDDPQSHLLLG